ncbi:hypothetical protein [Sphingomonas sp.]|uniref:hypothetical protein n=1 Tax=Sphingomonas sp. TaxID=28214 RepID=UPI0025FCE637|nr:hypothetical protein [Sphingomonas sp.]
MTAPSHAPVRQSDLNWWERRATVIMLALIATIPLFWPTIPPLVDLPGHMGRYRVQLDGDGSAIRHFYNFHWALIGNLGVDLLIVPLAKLLGLELGVKLIVMAIPAMTVAGLLWIAREVHGRVQPTALFALPLAYGHPFLFGFVNFSLSMALALLAFGLWLRLARLGRQRLRALVFLLISPLIWITHTFGWGMLGILAFSAELIRQHDRGIGWFRAWFHAGVQCLTLAPPILLMILWRSGHVTGQTGDWFHWSRKWEWFERTLRDRWEWFDKGSVAVLCALFVTAIGSRRLEISRNLGATALFLLVVFIVLPRIVFGSAYADMRLTPYLIAIPIIGIRLRPGASVCLARGLAIAGLLFFGVRIAANTVSFAIASTGYDRALGALSYVPEHARLVSFTGYKCGNSWSTNRMEHLGAIAIVRKRAYSNDQWDMAGAQLLTTNKPDAGFFRADPSQVVVAGKCRDRWRPLNWSLTHLPRDAFDYVWLIDPPAFDPALTGGMTQIWQAGTDRLYRIDDHAMLQATR